MVDTTDFDVEFNVEVPSLNPELQDEVVARLLELREGHTDMIGAAVGVEKVADATTPYGYKGRIVVYMRSKNIAAVEKGDTAEAALMEAMDAVERQVHKRREKLSERWKQP